MSRIPPPDASAGVEFLGEAAQAAAWRLAGVRSASPQAGAEVQALRAAAARSALVLLSARFAARLPAPLLEGALAQPLPLVVIVPEKDAPALAADPVSRVRRQLALEAGTGEPR